MGIATLVVWGLVAIIVLSVNPFEASAAVMGVFYGTLFLAVAGTFSLAGFVIRTGLLGKRDLISFQVIVAFRQALLLAALVVALLFLRSRGQLHWLSVLALIGAMTVIEFVFISVRFRRR
jgi:hypothetical protein